MFLGWIGVKVKSSGIRTLCSKCRETHYILRGFGQGLSLVDERLWWEGKCDSLGEEDNVTKRFPAQWSRPFRSAANAFVTSWKSLLSDCLTLHKTNQLVRIGRLCLQKLEGTHLSHKALGRQAPGNISNVHMRVVRYKEPDQTRSDRFNRWSGRARPEGQHDPMTCPRATPSLIYALWAERGQNPIP